MSVQVYYSEKYFVAGYGVDTREKALAIAKSLNIDPIEGIVVTEARMATKDEMLLAHTPQYVQGILTGRPERAAVNNGIGEWSRDLATSVQYSTGGFIQAAVEAYSNGTNAGALSSGIHHAKANHGAGFCTINSLIIAARTALAMGAKRVVILDFDAHCGGGTASLIKAGEGIEQYDVSVSSYDRYESTSYAQLVMSNGETYLQDIRSMLDSIPNPETIDLVLYNAGMDPHENCSTGGEAGIDKFVLYQREKMTFHWASVHNIPVAFALAGGYSGSRLSRAELVDLHRLTIKAAADFNQMYE
jgi:acetoin utilization deacetylase AcuC-like enzyme